MRDVSAKGKEGWMEGGREGGRNILPVGRRVKRLDTEFGRASSLRREGRRLGLEGGREGGREGK